MWKKLPDTSGMYCNTPVYFYTVKVTHSTGQIGGSKIWSRFQSVIGEKVIDTFWADWRGSFGNQGLQAMSIGVTDLCTLRMNWHPEIYELLRTLDVIIIKNANANAIKDGVPIRNHPDVYSVYGGIDDIRGFHSIMEFKVRRFEAK